MASFKRRHIMGGNSSSPEYTTSDSAESSHENSNSPLRSPDTTVFEDVQRGAAGAQSPFLRIVEEPIEKFRFRYMTEMQGPHGAIMGEKSSGRKKTKSWPSVKLCNYEPGQVCRDVIVRCTLTTTHENPDERITHVHRLICKRQGEEDDPVDVRLADPSHIAEFKNMTIIYTKKPNQVEELVKKKIRHRLKYITGPFGPSPDRSAFVEEAEREVKEKMTKQALNQACLKFEALVDNGRGFYEPLCSPIYSRPISNMKSSDYGDLKICKKSAWRGSCLGGDMVFIFVERVQKDNIKVKFFEIDNSEEIVWEEYAEFTPQDVHHQYGIVFTTPQYRNVDIEDNKRVYIQLYRPSDQATSEPQDWEYKPQNLKKEVKRKKPSHCETMPTFQQQAFSPMIPSTVPQPGCTAPQQTIDPEFDFLKEIITKEWPELPELSDLDIIFPVEQMDTEVTTSVTSSTPSITECVDKLITPDEEQARECILNLISNDVALKAWANLNQRGGEVERMLSEKVISSSGNQLDGMVPSRGFSKKNSGYIPESANVGEIKVEKSSTSKYGIDHHTAGPYRADHQTATHQMDYTCDLTHQMAVHQPSVSQTYESPRQRLARRLDRAPNGKHRTEWLVAEPQMEAARTVGQVRPAAKLLEINEDNCIVVMEKMVEKLNRLKMSGKLNDNHVRIVLNRLFSYTLGENGECLFHVLVERYSHPFPDMQMFLNLAKEYQIQQVLDQRNESGEAPLHIAVRAGKVETVIKLLGSGANVNRRDSENNTPIQLAVGRGYLDIVQALLSKHPDLSVVDEEGCSVLHTAVNSENLEMIAMLLVKQEGVRVSHDLLNQRDKKRGYTPLHMAVAHRYLAGIQLLLSTANCDVNAVNYSGVTPLGLVLESKFGVDREISYLLIRNKADPSLVNLSAKLGKDDKGESIEEENEDDEEVYDFEKYVQEWNKESRLFDDTIVAELCSMLDRCNGWKQLLPLINFSPLEIDTLSDYWSPSLMAFRLASSYKPEVKLETIRSAFLKMPKEYDEAIKIIDNYMLAKLDL